MAYILSLETATQTCSVALHHDEKLLAVQDFHLDKSHSSILHPLIRDMLRYCELEQEALDAVAVSMGPGSYTGLRIGTSAAKGLCFALDLPLIAVNTLEAMALGVQRYNTHAAWLCPMLDARRMEVYCLLQDAEGQKQMETTPLIVEEDSFAEQLTDHDILFFGNGSDKARPLLQKHARSHFMAGIQPSAQWIGQLALSKYQSQEFEDLAYFVPFYLKEFQGTTPKKGL
ncbi:MAG: tRNA (adenosine(37)-N6)-threonylcarbamoyltransferase complex dimerization subunit type 1 TsaB [Cyclobacteriaceae bacterium]